MTPEEIAEVVGAARGGAMKDWILDHSWIAWVPAMIPCAIGAALFAWWALELGSWMVWLQSAGYVSALLAWGAAMSAAHYANKRVEIWRENAAKWQEIAEQHWLLRFEAEMRHHEQLSALDDLVREGVIGILAPPRPEQWN